MSLHASNTGHLPRTLTFPVLCLSHLTAAGHLPRVIRPSCCRFCFDVIVTPEESMGNQFYRKLFFGEHVCLAVRFIILFIGIFFTLCVLQIIRLYFLIMFIDISNNFQSSNKILSKEMDIKKNRTIDVSLCSCLSWHFFYGNDIKGRPEVV